MKKIISFAICILFTFPLLAQHGVNFRISPTNKHLRKRSRKINSCLLIATRNGAAHAKMMNEVFPQKQPGTFSTPDS